MKLIGTHTYKKPLWLLVSANSKNNEDEENCVFQLGRMEKMIEIKLEMEMEIVNSALKRNKKKRENENNYKLHDSDQWNDLVRNLAIYYIFHCDGVTSFILIFHPFIPINAAIEWTIHREFFCFSSSPREKKDNHCFYIKLILIKKKFVESSKWITFEFKLANVSWFLCMTVETLCIIFFSAATAKSAYFSLS